MILDFGLQVTFLARICLLRSVVPDGSVILYRPSCSGNTRRGGFFAGAASKISISSTLTPKNINFIYEKASRIEIHNQKIGETYSVLMLLQPMG